MNGADDNPAQSFQSRRATLEDLPELRSLWHGARLPEDNLEKRFTEFQVATSSQGNIVAAVGLQILKPNGCIHSEAYTDPALSPEIRPLLWQRILTVAKNNGLHRLFTLPTASFYRDQGFVDADPNLRAKVPEVFGNPGADWISLKLRDDSPASVTAEQDFEVFAMTQRQESERMISKAKSFRVLAYGLLFLAMLGVAALAYVYSRVKRNR